MRTRLTLLPAAVALAVLTGCAAEMVTDTAALAPHTDTHPSEQDEAWMRTIHEGNLAEVQAGRLAQGKGTTREIKSIGKMLLDDHTKLDTKVTKAATQLGVQLPTSPTAEQRAEVIRLRDATGKDFDLDFAAGMTKAHTKALAATKKEVSSGSSPAVVALAKSTVPVLQQHLSALRKARSAE
jgi:putative membrane protein